jgi:6-pyruvoyl tetrahydropterin synthase/QueD family protein
MSPVVELHREYKYEAAHWLPHVPNDHKCRRMHGHSYRLTVTVRGEIHPTTGMLIDYEDIDAIVDPVIELLDHHTINDVISNSTAENQAVWLWEQLEKLPLSAITVHETARASCTYRGE